MEDNNPADQQLAPSGPEQYIQSVTIAVEGLHDEARALQIEAALRAKQGVESAVVDTNTERLKINYDVRLVHVPDLHETILRTGYKPSPEDEEIGPTIREELEHESDEL